MNPNRPDILTLPRLNLHGRQLFDLEVLLAGGFFPLSGFMNEDEYTSVVEDMRLRDGSLFPIPVVLDVPEDFPHAVGDRILLCDPYGNPLAILDIETRFIPDKKREAECVYGTTDTHHPGVQYLMHEMHDIYIGGSLEKLALPKRYDFTHFRHTPDELKSVFQNKGWDKVVGFQTRNPMHRVHFELVRRAHERTQAPVLVHPVVGMTKPGDIDYVTRVRTYNIVCNTYGKDFTYLSLLPLAMRMAGPREALWHSLVRKNYGCTHFIVGRDHAGPGKDRAGSDYYGPYDARELAEKHAPEIGIEIVPSDELAYSPARRAYVSIGDMNKHESAHSISGTEFRRMLREDEDIPEWFSFQESINILRESVRKDARPGVVFLFTGLSGAGKSTIAELLCSRLQEIQDRNITFLDGDVIRENLSKGLGFSKEDRDTNVRRVGFVASEVARHGGIAICSIIAPYRDVRRHVRSMVEELGVFIEIFVDTSIEECERRDTKGMYAKARQGIITGFTGIDDPYEVPQHPELILKTEPHKPEELVHTIIDYAVAHNIIKTAL